MQQSDTEPTMPDVAQEVEPALTADELARMDAEDRLLDDTSDGIDWDEIIATTQPDIEAGCYYTFEEFQQRTDALVARLERERQPRAGAGRRVARVAKSRGTHVAQR
jgi:hypothetical protein